MTPPIASLSAEELAGLVCQTLADAAITVTLTGGGCVSIWSAGRYVSADLDFIEEGPVPRRRLRQVLAAIGFRERNRYFEHHETPYLIEFPTGPLMVGDERVLAAVQRQTAAGRLRLLSPTDCVKDRLAAFFQWNDRQSLEQAVMVAQSQSVDLVELHRWSANEGKVQRFGVFRDRL